MVNAPAQHPEKALHTSPAARPGWSLHPLGKKQEVRRQRDQERPEQRRQHVQVEIPQQIDDDQTARGVQPDGQRDLLYIDVLAVHPRHGAGLGHADQRHDGGRNGHVVKRAGRHHHNDRRAKARQRLDDAARQRRQPHHCICHCTHRLFCHIPGYYNNFTQERQSAK